MVNSDSFQIRSKDLNENRPVDVNNIYNQIGRDCVLVKWIPEWNYERERNCDYVNGYFVIPFESQFRYSVSY